MIYEVMKHLRNFFPVKGGSRGGDWVISDGVISLPFLKDGQFFLIEGSIFNNGVYCYNEDILQDEEFYGYITPLAPPSEFLKLVSDIEKYQKQEEERGYSPFVSESFGGYSYTRGISSQNFAYVSWKEVFKGRLDTWRKM